MSRNRRAGTGRAPSNHGDPVKPNSSSATSAVVSGQDQSGQGMTFSAQPMIGASQEFSLRVWINEHQVIIAWAVSVIVFAFWFGVSYTNISRDIGELKNDVSQIENDAKKMAETQADLMVRVAVTEIKIDDSTNRNKSSESNASPGESEQKALPQNGPREAKAKP